MGVVLYAMVCGKPPFQAKTMQELYRRIKTVNFNFPYHCSAGMLKEMTSVWI
jgi:serine/threonine protein kinase